MLPSQPCHNPPSPVSPSKGGRIKHVLNVGAMHLDRAKLMCGGGAAPSRSLDRGVC